LGRGSKVTFTGPDGHGYRWQLGSSWKGDNLHVSTHLCSSTPDRLLTTFSSTPSSWTRPPRASSCSSSAPNAARTFPATRPACPRPRHGPLQSLTTFNVSNVSCHPPHNRHQLVLTPQSAPLAEFLILAALQRVWALGLAGPEVSVDEWAKLAAKADAEEYSIW